MFLVDSSGTRDKDYLRQGPTSCAFRDAVLHSTVVLRRYLHVCGLPVSFHDSFPSPSTSHQQAVFSHRTAADWMCVVCRTVLCKPLTLSCMKSLILELARLTPTITPHSKSLKSLVLHILTFNRTVTECLLYIGSHGHMTHRL